MRLQLLKQIVRHPDSPAFKLFRRFELQVLMNVTANAFSTAGKQIWNLPADHGLEAYARFTRQCADEIPAAPERLYQHFYALGETVRKYSGAADPEACEELVLLLYRGIGITMSGRIPGTIQVHACRFSRWYTPATCALISAMDAGLIAGICGHGSLTFRQRITAGCGRCLAEFKKESL